MGQADGGTVEAPANHARKKGNVGGDDPPGKEGSMKKYEIKTLADFARVPPDRLDACFAEFRECVAYFREMIAMCETIETPLDLPDLGFEWTDDGAPGMSAVEVEVELQTQQQTEPSPKPEPCRRAFSREEMIEEAKAYMRETWGPCNEAENRDRWHERLGMLVDFIHDRFPQGEGGQ
jgi:hypothetical protein